MNNLDTLVEYLPFLIPLIILQYGLAIYAIMHIIKHPNYKFGNQVMWIIISLFLSFIGPILYFMFGKGDDA